VGIRQMKDLTHRLKESYDAIGAAAATVARRPILRDITEFFG
jgi:hypothetical protein